MSKIIIVKQKNKIECDSCDYIIQNEKPFDPADVGEFVNMKCPKCQANLLTPKDFIDYLEFLRLVKRANKWLGWLSVFFGKQIIETESKHVKIHDGIYINKK